MASTAAAVTMAMPSPSTITQKGALSGSNALFHPLRPTRRAAIPTGRSQCRLVVRASSSSTKEKAVAGLTAAALAAALVIPDVAEAAPGISPSLKNFLLSIVAGGVVLGVLVGAVIGVANFDPVKRS